MARDNQSGEEKGLIKAAKEAALSQFIRRKTAALKKEKINNADLMAGSPMHFYCEWCGILIEILPEDYLFAPRTECSQCLGLKQMGWLNDAKNA